jgi:chemotaxis protein methyltransferase CheR
MSAVPHDAWLHIGERIGERLGLSFAPQRLGDLQRALARAAAELGFADPMQCAMHLLAEPADRARLDVLAAHLTVGETYFFRDPALFQALAESVLPALMRHGGRRSKRLRIWSAGCCTGEEAYSLAIVASEVLARSPGGSVEILATDVNPRFLEKAEAAQYGPWSFRGVALPDRARYFEPLEDGRQAVRPEIRRMVRFRCENLVDPGEEWLREVDLVVCRNVLMYFTPAQMRRTIRRLHDALVPGGWLVVSPSEGAAQRFPEFTPVMRGGAFLYRRKGAAEAQAPAAEAPLAPRPLAQPTTFPTIRLATPPSLPQASAREPGAAEPAALPLAIDYAARAKDCADRGALEEALSWCERWLAASRLDPAAHYLHAMVLLERGERDAAAAALRRALYVDPMHLMSHLASGNLARAEGREEEARRDFPNAASLAERMRASDAVADSDGLTAGALRETLAALLEPAHAA